MSRRTRPAAQPLAAALGIALVVTGCTGSSDEGVDLEGLGSGPCAPLVAALENVNTELRGLADDEATPEQAAERFVSVQDELAEAEVATGLEPAVTELITSLGFFRVSVDANTDEGDEVARVRAALGAVKEDCRTV